MKIRKIRIKNKGRVGGKNWTERVAEPEKTRIKLTNVLTIHCIVWSDVALIWRQMHLVWLCDVKNGKWKRIVYTVQKVKRQREGHKAINHFWPSPKMCKFPLWFSAALHLGNQTEEDTHGERKGGKNYNILCLAMKRSFKKSDNES